MNFQLECLDYLAKFNMHCFQILITQISLVLCKILDDIKFINIQKFKLF